MNIHLQAAAQTLAVFAMIIASAFAVVFIGTYLSSETLLVVVYSVLALISIYVVYTINLSRLKHKDQL